METIKFNSTDDTLADDQLNRLTLSSNIRTWTVNTVTMLIDLFKLTQIHM